MVIIFIDKDVGKDELLLLSTKLHVNIMANNDPLMRIYKIIDKIVRLYLIKALVFGAFCLLLFLFLLFFY